MTGSAPEGLGEPRKRDAPPPDLHVVLVAPEIGGNAGAVGRTCLAVGARLHLVRPFGFRLDAKHLKRAGLDYWPHVEPRIWTGWSAFEAALPELGTPRLFTAEATRSLWDADLLGDSEDPAVLIFGSERHGLPPAVRERWRAETVAIPMAEGPVRSLNLATAVAVAAYEVRRRLGPFP